MVERNIVFAEPYTRAARSLHDRVHLCMFSPHIVCVSVQVYCLFMHVRLHFRVCLSERVRRTVLLLPSLAFVG